MYEPVIGWLLAAGVCLGITVLPVLVLFASRWNGRLLRDGIRVPAVVTQVKDGSE